MGRKRSKVGARKKTVRNTLKTARSNLWSRVKLFWSKKKNKSSKRFNPHKSFKRSYREDYKRETKVPGILAHIMMTFQILLKNWKLFLPLLILMVILNFLLVGVMDEASYVQLQNILDETNKQITGGEDIGNVAKAGLLLLSTITTGGLAGQSTETATVFGVIVFLIIWLVTIFLLRHRMAGHEVKLRDGFYNAMTPMISTFVVLAVAFIQCIPILFLVIAYSSAIQTDFLSTPFYALVFFIFAMVMIVISGYLLSSSIIALVAVSAPGLYPVQALKTASELMVGRRIKFIIRIVALVLALAVVWVIIMVPLILFDLWMKTFEWTAGIPFIPICLNIMVCFTGIYLTSYLYLYYRWMLDA
ncbi:hypothetical protein IJH72_02965 [Candidatus Saccharibacteria bacterium]|nr:hypothetical protein [Candidatus Saccharibacteria bacterium]